MMAGLARPVRIVGADREHLPQGAVALDVIPGEDKDGWASAAAAQITHASHIIAVGRDAAGALAFAGRHTDRVVSLVLVDPEVDLTDPEHTATMADVVAPTLVIASAPTPGSSIEQPQSIAGGVDNGVFVIIEGSNAPSLASRPDSVLEWSTAFMEIAEGLAQARDDLITPRDES